MHFERVLLGSRPMTATVQVIIAMAPYRAPLGVSTDDQHVAADDGDKDQEKNQSGSLAHEAWRFRHLHIRAASAPKNTPLFATRAAEPVAEAGDCGSGVHESGDALPPSSVLVERWYITPVGWRFQPDAIAAITSRPTSTRVLISRSLLADTQRVLAFVRSVSGR